MSSRYFLDEPIAADRVTLDGPEAHHLIHVMRARPGERVVLFDGLGSEFVAEVARVGRSEVELTVISRAEVDRELSFSLALAVALPKGDRQKWIVEKAVELGVTRLVPLETARGVAQPVDSALKRLRRSVVEASKQCGRNRLMEIASPLDWPTLAPEQPEALRWLLHPGGRPVREVTAVRATEVVVAIGPEGGFTDAEVAAGREAGWELIDLGRRILRIETAALAIAAIVTGAMDA